jgi:hypothetical protein
MPKVKISEYSATANSNTDVASINIDEGCAPSGINNAIRAIMGHLKDFQSGTSNDPFTVGSSGSLTLSYGTANGVAYLNGSKVLTTGSALVFDGTNLGLGVTPSAWSSSFKVLQLANGTSLSNNGQTSYYQLGANNYYDGSNYKYIASNFAGFHRFSNAGAYEWHNAPSGTAGNAITFTQAMTLDASGNLGIGTTSPTANRRLDAVINANASTGIRVANNDAGSATSTNTTYSNGTTTAEFGMLGTGYGSYGVLTAGNGYIYVGSNKALQLSSDGGFIAFGTGTTGTERARIDTSGNLLVGTTSATVNATQTAKVVGGNFRSLSSIVTVPASSTVTLLTLSSTINGVYIISGNLGSQGNQIYGGMLIVVANTGSFRIVTNGSGSSCSLTLSGANVQITNPVGSALDGFGSAILVAN